MRRAAAAGRTPEGLLPATKGERAVSTITEREYAGQGVARRCSPVFAEVKL